MRHLYIDIEAVNHALFPAMAAAMAYLAFVAVTPFDLLLALWIILPHMAIYLRSGLAETQKRRWRWVVGNAALFVVNFVIYYYFVFYGMPGEAMYYFSLLPYLELPAFALGLIVWCMVQHLHIAT